MQAVLVLLCVLGKLYHFLGVIQFLVVMYGYTDLLFFLKEVICEIMYKGSVAWLDGLLKGEMCDM
jgi:hypothetical protein